MKKKTKQVLSILKPKCKALGFNSSELEGIAADIADNLELDEEASEEDINEKISAEVDSVVPYLKIAQKASNRVIQNYKNNKSNDDDNDEGEAGEGKSNKPSEEAEKIPAWAQALITQNKAIQTELVGLKSERVSDVRRAKLQALLKDTGVFGKNVLKNFDRMSFENESEFDDFYDGVTEDLSALNQERANAGLAKLGASSAQTVHKDKEDKPEVLSDKDIEELAETF
uniref:hypothetical protein n=1 Tax=Prevotella sp. TaxID=59823 RepID=UPI004029062F